MPIITIIICSKGRNTLAETICSITEQTQLPAEVIINFEWQRPSVYIRMNECIAKSKGEAFVILCDDDKLFPTFIEETSSLLTEGVDCVYSGLENFGDEIGVHFPDKFPFITCLFTKKVWKEVGGYEDDCGPYADGLFGMKVMKRGKSILIPKPLFYYRNHKDQATKFFGEEDWNQIKNRFEALK